MPARANSAGVAQLTQPDVNNRSDLMSPSVPGCCRPVVTSCTGLSLLFFVLGQAAFWRGARFRCRLSLVRSMRVAGGQLRRDQAANQPSVPAVSPGRRQFANNFCTR